MDEAFIEAAERQVERERESQINAIRAKSEINIEGNGVCYACPDPTPLVEYKGRMIHSRFCCPECAEDYENGVRNVDNPNSWKR